MWDLRSYRWIFLECCRSNSSAEHSVTKNQKKKKIKKVLAYSVDEKNWSQSAKSSSKATEELKFEKANRVSAPQNNKQRRSLRCFIVLSYLNWFKVQYAKVYCYRGTVKPAWRHIGSVRKTKPKKKLSNLIYSVTQRVTACSYITVACHNIQMTFCCNLVDLWSAMCCVRKWKNRKRWGSVFF